MNNPNNRELHLDICINGKQIVANAWEKRTRVDGSTYYGLFDHYDGHQKKRCLTWAEHVSPEIASAVHRFLYE